MPEEGGDLNFDKCPERAVWDQLAAEKPAFDIEALRAHMEQAKQVGQQLVAQTIEVPPPEVAPEKKSVEAEDKQATAKKQQASESKPQVLEQPQVTKVTETLASEQVVSEHKPFSLTLAELVPVVEPIEAVKPVVVSEPAGIIESALKQPIELIQEVLQEADRSVLSAIDTPVEVRTIVPWPELPQMIEVVEPASKIEPLASVDEAADQMKEASFADETPALEIDEGLESSLPIVGEVVDYDTQAVYEQLLDLMTQEVDLEPVEVASELDMTTEQDVEPVIMSMAEIVSAAPQQSLEQTFNQLKTCLEYDAEAAESEVVVVIRELAESIKELQIEGAEMGEAGLLTPEITEKLLDIIQKLGYQEADKVLVEYVKVRGYKQLIETLRALAQIEAHVTENAENRAGWQAGVWSNKVATSDASYDLARSTSGIGRLVFRMVLAQPAFDLAA